MEEADNSGIYLISGIRCAVHSLSDKDLVKVVDTHWKKGGWISRIDITLDVANNTIFPLSKMIESRKSRSLQKTEKDVLTDLMKRDASGAC